MAESRGELALRTLTDHLIEDLCPDINEPAALTCWGALLHPPMKEMVPASFLSQADGADSDRSKPARANALSMCLMTSMVASLWDARDDAGYSSFWIDRAKEGIGRDASYVELSLDLWTFHFACQQLKSLYVRSPGPAPPKEPEPLPAANA